MSEKYVSPLRKSGRKQIRWRILPVYTEEEEADHTKMKG
jgi:hypothetical protein